MSAWIVAVLLACAQSAFGCSEKLNSYQFSKEQKYVVDRVLSIEPLPDESAPIARFWSSWPDIDRADKESQTRCWRQATTLLADLQRSFWSNVISASRNGDPALSAEFKAVLGRLRELPPAATALFSIPDAVTYQAYASEFIAGAASRREVVWMGTKIPPNMLESNLDTGNWDRVAQFLAEGIAKK